MRPKHTTLEKYFQTIHQRTNIQETHSQIQKQRTKNSIKKMWSVNEKAQS